MKKYTGISKQANGVWMVTQKEMDNTFYKENNNYRTWFLATQKKINYKTVSVALLNPNLT